MQNYKNSNIYLDGVGIDSYPSAEDYEGAVSVILDRIFGTSVGSAVKTELGRTSRILRFIPLDMGTFNAYASPASAEGSTAKGQLVRDNHGHVALENGHGSRGSGIGTSARLKFNPRFWTKYCCSNGTNQIAGAKPDEIVIHEMTHATRQMRGINNRVKAGDKYDNSEEFFAIVVANMYASETGRSVDLRLDHHSFSHAAFDTNQKFLPRKDDSDYKYALIKQMIGDQTDFATDLAGLDDVAFNPFRRYYELQR